MDQKLWVSFTKDEETEEQELRISVTEEAIAGWERAKRETIFLKKEVDKVLREKGAALKECMQQLNLVRQEQDKRIHSAVMKASQEFDEKLVEAGKRIARLQGENSELHRAASGKEKVIDELRKYTSEVEAELKARILRAEKVNASLKYEVRVLEKELEIRNEEAEVSRRTADIAQKQQRESAEKITKLESECLRLRLLVRRRLPGPAALMKMKNEVIMLGNDDAETGKQRSKAPSKRINFPLIEKLVRVEEEEEEKRSAVHALNTKSRLTMESGNYLFVKEERSVSDLDSSDDKGSCVESWPSLENFKNENQLSNRYMGTPEMNLMMDDFAEMEKLALDDQAASESLNLEVSGTANEKDTSTTKMNDEKLESNVRIPVGKILELLEGINAAAESFPGKDDKVSYLANPTGYTVRVFQWKTDELSAHAQQLFQTCSDLLNGETELEQFVQVVASSLEWIMSNCFSIQDVSSIKAAVRSGLNWDELSGEDSCSAAKSTRLNIQNEDVLCIPLNGPYTEQVDIGSLPSEEVIESPQPEKETTGKSEGKNGDQMEKQQMMKQGLDIQLMETNLLNDLDNNYSSFERYKNDKNTHLQSHTNKEGQADASSKELRNDWEITTASEKLAECQETLVNLGKQLKALTSPRPGDAAIFDKVMSTPADHVITSTPTLSKHVSKRFSLQEKMIEEDKDQIITSPSPRTIDGTSANAVVESCSKFTNPNGIDREADKTAIASMSIIPHKNSERRSLLKKLLLWKTKGKTKKTPPLKQH